VKLKVKRDDSPRSVASNFARIYGLNQKSEEALAAIIDEQMKKEKLQISSIKTLSQQSRDVPTTIKEGFSHLDNDDSFDQSLKQLSTNLSNLKFQQKDFEQSLGMIEERQKDEDEYLTD